MWLSQLCEEYIGKIPVGDFFALFVTWLRDYFSGFFDLIRLVLDNLLNSTLDFLLLPPPSLFIIVVSVIVWFLQKRWQSVVTVALGLFFVINQGYWLETMQTTSLIFWSCILCMGIGVPIGVFGAHHPKFYVWIKPVLSLMQTLPTFVYLIPAIIFFRIGMVPGLIATIFFVLPTSIRLTQIGIASTPKNLLEAGKSFGASHYQLLWKIELPYAIPQIRESLTQTIMLSLSMVVISATVGGNGLGVPVYRALQQYNASLGFEAGCVIVVVAIVLDTIFRFQKPKRSKK